MHIDHACEEEIIFTTKKKIKNLFSVDMPDDVAGHVQAKGHIISWWDSGHLHVLWGLSSGGGGCGPHPDWTW